MNEYDPPPAVMRGLSSSHIPVVDLEPVRARPQTPAPKLPAAQVPVAAPEKEYSFLDAINAVTKTISGETEKADRQRELNEILEALKQQPVTFSAPEEVAAAQARVLDPTQAPEGAPVQVDLSGVPQNYLSRNRSAESGGDDAAVNPNTGAAGRYQFLPSTAESIRKANPHLNISDKWRTNADDQEKLMQAYTQQSVGMLKKQLGRDPTGGELYLLHLLGHGGGSQVLGNLDAPLAQLTSEQARRFNPVLRAHKTGRELLNYFNRRF